MFDSTSRYYALETAAYTGADGRAIAYARRRFLPRGESMRLLVEITVAQDDRMDLISGRTIGEPLQFWRICDINNALDPFDLIKDAGSTISVPIPEVTA